MSNGERVLLQEDRLPPQNLEAEMGVIGSALLDPATLAETADHVGPEDFYRAAHGLIWRAVLDLHGRGERVDAVTVAETMERAGTLDRAGGADYLAEIIASVPHAGHALAYSQIVRQKSAARGLIEAANATLRDAYANTSTAEDLCSRAEEAIFAVAGSLVRGHEPIPIAEAVASARGTIDRRRDGEVIGVPSGFDDLDAITDGWHPGQVVLVAGRPGQGKSAFALTVADHAARAAGISTLLVSLEMGRTELGERYLSMRSGIDGYRLKNAYTLTIDDWALLATATDNAHACRLAIDDRPSATIAQVAANARRYKARRGLGLLVVDYVQLVEGPRQPGESREQEVARVSRRFKTLARELGVPVLLLAQLNRKNEAREDRRPQLADLRESGQLEQDADHVLLLHRPEYYDPADLPGVAEVIVAKNRNGRTGTVRLCFEGKLARFSALAPGPIVVNDF